MTFDTARSCTLLFGGGTRCGQALREHWVFDGAEWTSGRDIGPSLRTDTPPRSKTRTVGTCGVFRRSAGRGDGVTTRGPRHLGVDGATWTQIRGPRPAKPARTVWRTDSDKNGRTSVRRPRQLTAWFAPVRQLHLGWTAPSGPQVGRQKPDLPRAPTGNTSTVSVVTGMAADFPGTARRHLQWASGGVVEGAVSWALPPRRGHSDDV